MATYPKKGLRRVVAKIDSKIKGHYLRKVARTQKAKDAVASAKHELRRIKQGAEMWSKGVPGIMGNAAKKSEIKKQIEAATNEYKSKAHSRARREAKRIIHEAVVPEANRLLKRDLKIAGGMVGVVAAGAISAHVLRKRRERRESKGIATSGEVKISRMYRRAMRYK